MSALNSAASTEATVVASSICEHDYNGSQSPELCPLPESDPSTPSKPDGKRLKSDLTLTQVQNNIASLINERSDNLESMINLNTVSIDALKKSIDFVFTEVETLKADVKAVKLTCENTVQRTSELEMKLNETERYQRRWNLRLHGILENKQENIRAEVADICSAMVGTTHAKIKENIDIIRVASMTHRRGREQRLFASPTDHHMTWC